jgi:hypothetical protein
MCNILKSGLFPGCHDLLHGMETMPRTALPPSRRAIVLQINRFSRIAAGGRLVTVHKWRSWSRLVICRLFHAADTALTKKHTK